MIITQVCGRLTKKISPIEELLNDPKISFYIIDQSVTGMFERKTRVGL